MPKVLNKKRDPIPPTAKLVDRTTKFGNPFVMKDESDAERDRVCDRFDVWVMLPKQAELRQQAREELRGQDLVCWCKPKRCHGDTWLRIANANYCEIDDTDEDEIRRRLESEDTKKFVDMIRKSLPPVQGSKFIRRKT